MKAFHDMPFGARLHDGGAEFRLWAPAAASAAVVLNDLDGERLVPAERADGGWYRADVADLRAGQLYQWQIEGELRVPDPASRFNPQGPHGPSQVVDALDFEWDNEWRGRPWHEAAIYELHVGCFTPAGSLASAELQLPSLAALGITAIQLMPMASWPGRFGWGYDGVLPFALHAAYGSPPDLKRFIQAAHRLKMMVFVDVVYNHFGPDGNYLARYAPQFFSQRHHTAWGPAINFDDDGSDTVREFFIHNALYWVEEFRIDGLRFDAVHAMVDERRPHIVEEISHRVRALSGGRHVHLVLENDSNDAARLARPGVAGRFDGQWNGDFHHTLHVLLTGERDGYYAEYDRPLEQLVRVLTAGFAFEGAPNNTDPAAPRREATSHVPLSATVNFLQNHDQIGNRAFGERLATLAAPQALRVATAILLLGVSPPLVFMGEEFASTTPFLYFADWQGELREAVRRGRIAEFAHFPRHAEAAARGELPDPCSDTTFRRCKLDRAMAHSATNRQWRRWFNEVLTLRHRELVPHLPKLRDDGHRWWRIGPLAFGLRWAFEDGRVLQMVANLDHIAVRMDHRHGSPPLVQPTLLYSVGEVIDDLLGAHAAAWHWGLR